MRNTSRLQDAGILLPKLAGLAVLLSAFAGATARAQDSLPGTAYAMAVVFSRGGAEEVAAPAEKAATVSAAEDHIAPATQIWILRQIIGHKVAPTTVALIENEKAAPAGESGTGKSLAGAPTPETPAAETAPVMPEKSRADPNFQKWQSDADEKLKREVDVMKRKESPLALAHPDSFVVVCEAGCREPKDHIIYMVLKTAASTRRLDVASSEAAEASIPSQASLAVEDPGSLPCVAGCYDRVRTRDYKDLKKVDNREPPSPRIVLASLVVASVAAEPANTSAVADQTHGTIRNSKALAMSAKRHASSALRSHGLALQAARHNRTERPHRQRPAGRYYENITLLGGHFGSPAQKLRRISKLEYRFSR